MVELSRPPGFRLRLRLLLLLLLHPLLLLLVALLILALQRLQLLRRLRHWLEEALEPRLLARLQVLGEPRRARPHAVLAEPLLRDEELHEALDVRRFPLEVALWVRGGPHVRVEEELARVGEWPVVRQHVFAFAGLDGFDELFERAVLADEF